MDSLINSDKIETEVSNKKVDKVEKFEETVIKECKEIIRKKMKTFYALRITYEKFLEDSKRKKSLSN